MSGYRFTSAGARTALCAGLLVVLGVMGGSRPALAQGVNKQVLNGPVTVRIIVEGNVQRVTFLSQKPYPPQQQFAALDAVRIVQHDVAASCAKLCKPAKMVEPRIDAQGFLSFDIALQGLPRRLSLADIPLLLQGKPLPAIDPTAAPAPASPAPLAVPVPAPKPAAPAAAPPPQGAQQN